jgi:hypothetical protein
MMLALDLDMMAEMSEPVAQAYLDALALCEAENRRQERRQTQRKRSPSRPPLNFW